ncbi:MAG: hypothetical protein ACK5JO_05895 [Halodesulfovibrio sp.]
MKQKKVKRKVLHLFGRNNDAAPASGTTGSEGDTRGASAASAKGASHAAPAGSGDNRETLEDPFPYGFGSDVLERLVDGEPVGEIPDDGPDIGLGPNAGSGPDVDTGLHDPGEAWESALSGAGDDGTNPLRGDDAGLFGGHVVPGAFGAGMRGGQGLFGANPEDDLREDSGGVVLPLFGSRRSPLSGSRSNQSSARGQWHGGADTYLPADLGELLELLSMPEFGPSALTDEGQSESEPPLRFPTLDRVMGRLGTAISRRLYALSTRRWVVVPSAARRVRFAAWTRFSQPVAATLSLLPLEGQALLGADSDLVQLITSRLLDRGPERSFPELHPQTKEAQLSQASQAVAAHCLHVFQLDLEWALAPFFEVETSRCRVLAPEEPIIEFGEQEECILVTFSVSDGEFSGRLMLLFPADMLRPLEMLLASNARVLMPASTETDDEAFLRLRILSDEQLGTVLSESHPLLASVVLYQMSEDRRVRILQRLNRELQEELVRRMGRRASVLRTLSIEQRVAVRSLLMGEAYTSHILRMCTPEKAARFLGTIATLPSLFPSQATEICAEDNPGLSCGSPLVVDKGIVGRLLMRSFTSDTFVQVSKLLSEGAHALPFDNLSMCSAEAVASLLGHETYGVCGLVLRHLLRKSPELAASVFVRLREEAQAPVLERVLMPRSVDVDIVHTVEHALCAYIPLACNARDGARPIPGEVREDRRASNLLCSSDAFVLLSAMPADARKRLVDTMEQSGIPMPADCKPA